MREKCRGPVRTELNASRFVRGLLPTVGFGLSFVQRESRFVMLTSGPAWEWERRGPGRKGWSRDSQVGLWQTRMFHLAVLANNAQLPTAFALISGRVQRRFLPLGVLEAALF